MVCSYRVYFNLPVRHSPASRGLRVASSLCGTFETLSTFVHIDRRAIEPQKELDMSNISEGDAVKWDWGNGSASGTVQSVFSEKTTRTIKGSEVTRNGTKDDPALYIKQDDGDAVLKLASEVKTT